MSHTVKHKLSRPVEHAIFQSILCNSSIPRRKTGNFSSYLQNYKIANNLLHTFDYLINVYFLKHLPRFDHLCLFEFSSDCRNCGRRCSTTIGYLVDFFVSFWYFFCGKTGIREVGIPIFLVFAFKKELVQIRRIVSPIFLVFVISKLIFSFIWTGCITIVFQFLTVLRFATIRSFRSCNLSNFVKIGSIPNEVCFLT